MSGAADLIRVWSPRGGTSVQRYEQESGHGEQEGTWHENVESEE